MRLFLAVLLLMASFKCFARECTFEEREAIYNEIKNPSNEYSQSEITRELGEIVAAALIQEWPAQCDFLGEKKESSTLQSKYRVITASSFYEILYSYDEEAGYPNGFTISEGNSN